MKPHSYHAFIADIRRYRPSLTIALSIVAVIPSFVAFLHQDLSPILVLGCFAESLIVVGVLVWSTTGVLLRYARKQAKAEKSSSREDEMMA